MSASRSDSRVLKLTMQARSTNRPCSSVPVRNTCPARWTASSTRRFRRSTSASARAGDSRRVSETGDAERAGAHELEVRGVTQPLLQRARHAMSCAIAGR